MVAKWDRVGFRDKRSVGDKSHPALMFYVYCLKNCGNQKLYYGYTNDLVRRCKEHGSEWELVYYEGYKSSADARRREVKLKDHGQARGHLKRRIKNSLA